MKEVLESCDGVISFDKLNDNDANKNSLLYSFKIIKDFFIDSIEEIGLKKFNKIKSIRSIPLIKSSPEMVRHISDFSTLTN